MRRRLGRLSRQGHGTSAASAFRPSAPSASLRAPTRAQALTLLTILAIVAGGVAVAAALVKPSKARSFDLVYGSAYLNDNYSPVSVDLASGKPAVRLSNAAAAVAAVNTADVDMVGLGDGNTLMLDRTTGEFNMVDSTGFVVKTSDGGVDLPATADGAVSSAYADDGAAYIVRTATSAASPSASNSASNSASTSVYLVSQSTVADAVGSADKTKARASLSVNVPLADVPSPAASADGALWLLTGTSALTVTELQVPAGSNAGAALAESRYETVAGPAAVASATRDSDGSGGEVAAVAGSATVRVFDGGGASDHQVRVRGAVRAILSASGAQGSVAFLYDTTAGWDLVTTDTSGVDPARVTPLTGVDPSAELVTPAWSDGTAYTMDATTGSLWQVRDGVTERIPGAESYPFIARESHLLGSPEVVAAGSRVIFNSRTSYEAEVVFSDGSHDPRVIAKRSAVAVDPTSAEALADLPAANVKPGSTTTPKQTTSRRPAPTARPRQQIDTKLNCSTAVSKPHQPVATVSDRAARSVVVQWSYPTLDPSDCIPSTYVVSIMALSAGAPRAPGQVTVPGADGVTLTGLFPATQYEITVTAYLNQQRTTSLPVLVTTGPEGPPAPTGVRAATDGGGNWTVSWNSCGGLSRDCVPTASWYLLPSFCDGRGLSGLPDKVVVTGDPTQHSFSQVYAGSDATLGRALCFRVQGVGAQGTAGDTSAATSPEYSWAEPTAAALTLTASQPATTSLGATTTTTVDLALGNDPVRAVGGLGATITFHLVGAAGGATAIRSVIFSGRSTLVSATFTGIAAGTRYSAGATVAPPGHPGSAVTVPAVAVTTRSSWPSLGLAASCPTQGSAIVLDCTLDLKVNGVGSARAGGELFSVVNGQLTCGNTGFSIDRDDFDPATQTISQTVDLLDESGTCTVSLALVEGSRARDPRVFGGTTSPTVSTTLDLGHASTLAASQAAFAVSWDTTGGSSVKIQYTGARTDAQVAALSDQWVGTLRAPNGAVCGESSAQPTHAGIIFVVNPASCVNEYGAETGAWTVGLTYQDRGVANGPHSFAYTLDQGPPGYVPCTVGASDFTATWAADGSENVDVAFTQATPQLAGCGAWDFYLLDATQATCSHLQLASYAGADDTLPVATACTVTLGYTVVITYVDPSGTTQMIGPILVGGAAPISAPPSSSPPPSGTPPGSPSPSPDPSPDPISS